VDEVAAGHDAVDAHEEEPGDDAVGQTLIAASSG